MLSSSPVTHSCPGSARLSPQLVALRRSLPYSNYAPSIIVSHAHPEKLDSPSHANWTGPRGYGAKHRLDQAPFSLWDEEKADFRYPTDLERQWLISRFDPAGIHFQFPIVVIETDNPPRPLPLTVAAVAAKFVPSPLSPVARNANGMRIEPIEDARPIHFSTDYAGMRGPEDPLHFTFTKWTQPPENQLQLLVKALFGFCNPRSVHILCPYLIVELHCDDRREYRSSSLPRTIGGYATIYHHDVESAFKGLSTHARQIIPDASTQDTSDYLSMVNELYPGVRVTSATLADNGLAPAGSMSTTAGVLLRDGHGNQRLTVANHGFLDRQDVFHPFENNAPIGEIVERWEALDIALVRLNPSVRFDNNTYFESKIPRRLLRSAEIPDGKFFSLDGMSTGVVFMQSQGLTLDFTSRPQNSTNIPYYKMRIYRALGSINAVPRAGVCGAAIVEDETDEGGVAGFFQNGDDDFSLSPCLDELIDCSWSVV